MLIIRSRRPQIPVWSIMGFAAFVVVLSDLVSVDELGSVVNIDVVLFLIGMFSIVSLADESGLLNAISIWVLTKARSVKHLFLLLAILFGFLAAIAVNDTVALMGPPIVLTISRAIDLDPRPLFLLLAFSLTIGSVATPMGNPQNVLIAVESGIEAPFTTFIVKLLAPTVINLLATGYTLFKFYRVEDKPINIVLIPHEAIKNRRDAILAATGLISVVVALIVNDVFEILRLPHVVRRGFIPFVIASAIYILSSNPRKVLASVDWGTIVFFIMMFITMEGIWRSGILDILLKIMISTKIRGFVGIATITGISILFSQVLSNVPFVKLFIDYMHSLGYTGRDVDSWLALAMSSTIAGNLTILGAASNIIILEVLESRIGTTITFTEFLKIGAIVTLINTLIYLQFFIY